MRTIIFRGYSQTFNSWFYGDLLITRQPSTIVCEESGHEYEVEPNSVGQFTGLHDKNGKEIYEGDILEDTLGRKKLVEYYKDGFWLNASLEGAEWCLRHVNSSSKIIGSIYENPELLTD